MTTDGPVPFGRYRLLSLLGEGGMAKVYRALLSGPMGFEKEVAVKRLDMKLTADERVIRSLINEARLGGQLRHKNIVETYEFNQVNGNYFLAMEYVDGWTLEEILLDCRQRRALIPTTVVARLLIEICRGLHYAHELADKDGGHMNLVHRDLKPGNVIVSRSGEVKLMDFGIAKANTNLYKTTAADVTKGTPMYMSPEQVTGEALDCRSDLFSLGALMYELLTNEVPFEGDNLLQLMHKVLYADITEATARLEQLCPAFVPLLEGCLAREPSDRFESARALAKATRAVRDELPPGPDFDEWLDQLLERLPGPHEPGDFGLAGPPQPQAVGTQSLVPLGTASPEDVPPVLGDAFFDAFADVDTDAETADALSGRSEAFFDTGPVNATRMQKSIPGVAAPGSRKARRNAVRLKAKKKRRAVLVAGIGAGVLGVALIAVALFLRPQGGRGPAELAAVEPTASPARSPAAEPSPSATPALPEVSPAPTASPAASPAPTPRATPKPAATPAAKPVATPAAKPASKPTPKPSPANKPTPRPREAVATADPGYVDFNSKPWSNVIVDGKPIKTTPVIKHALPPGKHSVVFDCTSCDPPRRETRSFVVEPGVRSKQIVMFDP